MRSRIASKASVERSSPRSHSEKELNSEKQEQRRESVERSLFDLSDVE